MAAATLLDMSLIANDSSFKGRVQASVYGFCTTTLQSETNNNHTIRKAYAAQVLNNPNTFMNNFVWAAASNQTLANDVITANGGTNFTASTTAATVAAAVTTATPTITGATDTDINNAVANAFIALANA
jgi:hypothetical protein